MRVIETTIHISASPEDIWSILIDFENYSSWNPFIKNISGTLAIGEKIEVCIAPTDNKRLKFKPTITSLNDNHELSWLGVLLFPGLFDGKHSFKIIKKSSGCDFIQKECFSGFLVPFVWSGLNENTRNGFEKMNQSIKTMAESKVE